MQAIERTAPRRLPSISGLAALVVACESPGPPGPPVATTIEVSPPTWVLEDVPDSVWLTATVKDQYGEAMPSATVAWSSIDSLVVHLAEDGLVAAEEPGKALVEASAGEVKGDATVVVAPGPRAVLHKFYRVMNGDAWERNNGWKTDVRLTLWYGVSGFGEQDVEGLRLGRNGLSGEIPFELGNLRNLRSLDLSRNRLEGEIPPELGNLRYLEQLYLDSTELEGEIPPELGNLANLTDLFLHSNRLAGEIPPELGNLTILRRLFLRDNQLTGEVPPQLGGLANLTSLVLDSNQLTGPVPPELGNIESLRALTIADNPLTGALPRELARLHSLRVFHWNDTGLCAPADDAFQSWLNGIADQVGNRNCDS